MNHLYYLVIFVLFYTMLAQSLILPFGYAGLISLASAGFYGIGAYSAAILSVNFGYPFLFVLLVSILVSGILSFIVAIVAMRTADDYLIILTIGIQIVLFSLMNNWVSLTNGPYGIANILNISFLGITILSNFDFLILTICLSIGIFILIRKISLSPYGRVLIALSEDEIFCKSIGKNVFLKKAISFSIGGSITAIPGVLYAYYIKFVDPSTFSIEESIFILSIVIIGGVRNLWGSVLAATVLILLPEALRFLGMPSNIAANMRQIIYGLVLVVMMFRFSRGFGGVSRAEG